MRSSCWLQLFIKNLQVPRVLKEQTGFAIAQVLIATILISGIAYVFSEMYLLMKGSQDIVFQRQFVLIEAFNTTQLLKDPAACNATFVGISAPAATSVPLSEIKAANGDTYRQVGEEYGNNARLRLIEMHVHNFRYFFAGSDFGTLDLILVYKGPGAGITSRALVRRVLIATQVDGAGMITGCRAIGSEANTFWARSSDPADPDKYPDHIYLAGPDTDGDGIGNGIGTGLRLGVGTNAPVQTVHVSAQNSEGWFDTINPQPTDGNVYVTGNFFDPTTSATVKAGYVHESDIGLKVIEKPINGFQVVQELQPKRFRWLSNGNKSLGLIAQDVESTMPEIVHGGAKGMMSVEYDLLVAPLVEANIELRRQVTKAKLQLQATENQFEFLKNRLQQETVK